MSFSKAKLKRFNDIKEPSSVALVVSKTLVKEDVNTKKQTNIEKPSIKSTPSFKTRQLKRVSLGKLKLKRPNIVTDPKSLPHMTPKKKAKEVKVKNVNKAISGCQSDSESVKSIPCYEKVEDKLRIAYEQDLKEKMVELERKFEDLLSNQKKESDAILKECQTISEFNIIQCELEKNKISSELEVRTKDFLLLEEKYQVIMRNYDEMKTKFKTLEQDLSRIVVELNETRQKLSEELDAKEKAIEALRKEKTSYEISIKTYQATIAVLTKRLIHSDGDVEQLKEELSKCEEKIIEYETKCMQLSADLKLIQISNEELEMQFDSTIKLNLIETEYLKEDLCKKVDLYKEEVEKYTRRLKKEESEKQEIMDQLHEAFDITQKLQAELDRINDINAQYEFEIRRGQNELDGYHLREMDWGIRTESYEDTVKEIEDELRSTHEQLSNLQTEVSHLRNLNRLNQQSVNGIRYTDEEEKSIYAKYIQISGRYDDILVKFEELQKENLEKDQIINKLSAHYREYQELKEKYLDQERNMENLLKKIQILEEKQNDAKDVDVQVKLDNSVEQQDVLLDKIHRLEGELKEVSEKYADLVGHHNTKQKIKHLVDLKHKNEELTQENINLMNKLQSQKKIMEKFKKENAELKKGTKKQKYLTEDKENFGSPTRSLNSSRVESPFRERN